MPCVSRDADLDEGGSARSHCARATPTAPSPIQGCPHGNERKREARHGHTNTGYICYLSSSMQNLNMIKSDICGYQPVLKTKKTKSGEWYFGNRFRSCDLGVMGPARFHCAIPNAGSAGAQVTEPCFPDVWTLNYCCYEEMRVNVKNRFSAKMSF